MFIQHAMNKECRTHPGVLQAGCGAQQFALIKLSVQQVAGAMQEALVLIAWL